MLPLCSIANDNWALLIYHQFLSFQLSSGRETADRLWICQSWWQSCWWQSSLIHFAVWPKILKDKLTLTHKLSVAISLHSPRRKCFIWSLLVTRSSLTWKALLILILQLQEVTRFVNFTFFSPAFIPSHS